MQFARKARPETLEAAKAVSSVLAVEFKTGSCSPLAADSGVNTIKKRLAKESYKGTKPQVVFFTCETATVASTSRGSSKRKAQPKVTQQATISRKVYDSVFDVVAARDAVVYTTCTDLTKVDIANITKKQDRFLNRDTGPFMAFYKPDGTLSGYLQGRLINKSNYCREVAKIVGSPAEARKRFASMSRALKQLEMLVSKNYILKQKHAEAIAKANKQSSKSKTSRGSASRGKSNAQKLADSIQVKVRSADDEIASVKQSITALTAQPIATQTK